MMRRIGVALLVVLALWAGPGAFAEDCVREGGGPAGGGVVLGPATKCVKEGTASLPASDSDGNAATVGDAQERTVPWAGIGIAVALTIGAGLTARRAILRRAARGEAEAA